MARAHADYATALGSLSHATGLTSTAVGGGWDDLNGDGVVDDNEVSAATGENASAFGIGTQATADDTIPSRTGSRAAAVGRSAYGAGSVAPSSGRYGCSIAIGPQSHALSQ